MMGSKCLVALEMVGDIWMGHITRNSGEEFPLWLRGLRIQYSDCEDVDSIPGLAQWVKDLVLLQAAAQVTDMAWIWCCCGCGIGRHCGSHSTPCLETSMCHRCSRKKKKERKNETAVKFLSKGLFYKQLSQRAYLIQSLEGGMF